MVNPTQAQDAAPLQQDNDGSGSLVLSGEDEEDWHMHETRSQYAEGAGAGGKHELMLQHFCKRGKPSYALLNTVGGAFDNQLWHIPFHRER
jgi:hypothetical protein